MGKFIGEKNASLKRKLDIKNKIFQFLRNHKIRLLKESELNTSKVEEIYQDLKRERENFKEDPEDSDLKIISIYKVAEIDCIFSNNIKHFEEPCKYVKILLEKPFMIKKGYGQEVEFMWRKTFPKKRKKR